MRRKGKEKIEPKQITARKQKKTEKIKRQTSLHLLGIKPATPIHQLPPTVRPPISHL
jgi:hypothetical protein